MDVNGLYGWPISQKLPVNDFVLIEENVQKVEKLVTDLHDKTEYVGRIRNLKEVLNPGLILKKVHRVIKFDQNSSLNPFIEMKKKSKK